MIHFTCPSCNNTLKVPDKAGGKKGNCPKCGQRLRVPAPQRNRTVLGVAAEPPTEAWIPSPSVAGNLAAHGQSLFHCPGCNSLVAVSADGLGRVVECHNCRVSFAAIRNEPMPPRANFSDGLNREHFEGVRKHSGLGIASFLIAVLVIGLDVILGVVIATNIARDQDQAETLGRQLKLAGQGWAMYSLNCMSLPLCLVGFGLAFVGVVVHRDRHNFFTWLGFFGNGVVIVTVVGLYVLSMLK